jgi:hypothetical protein
MSRMFLNISTAFIVFFAYVNELHAGANDAQSPKIAIWYINDSNGGGASHLNAQNQYESKGKVERLVKNKVVYTNGAHLTHL